MIYLGFCLVCVLWVALITICFVVLFEKVIVWVESDKINMPTAFVITFLLCGIPISLTEHVLKLYWSIVL